MAPRSKSGVSVKDGQIARIVHRRLHNLRELV
jgi:hypothetical protein